MKAGDKVRFTQGKRKGEVWIIRDFAVGYWCDDEGREHENHTIGLVPNEQAMIMLDARYEDLEVV